MRNGFVSHTAEGLLGGALGALVLYEATRRSDQLPDTMKPTRVRWDPGDFLLSRVEQMTRRPMRRGLRGAVAQGLHIAHVLGWGGLLGFTTARRHIRTMPEALLLGAGLGAAAWAAGYIAWLPAMKLAPPIHRQGIQHVATTLLTHVSFGVATSIPIYLVDRFLRRPEPWYRRGLFGRSTR